MIKKRAFSLQEITFENEGQLSFLVNIFIYLYNTGPLVCVSHAGAAGPSALVASGDVDTNSREYRTAAQLWELPQPGSLRKNKHCFTSFLTRSVLQSSRWCFLSKSETRLWRLLEALRYYYSYRNTGI